LLSSLKVSISVFIESDFIAIFFNFSSVTYIEIFTSSSFILSFSTLVTSLSMIFCNSSTVLSVFLPNRHVFKIIEKISSSSSFSSEIISEFVDEFVKEFSASFITVFSPIGVISIFVF